MVMAPPERPWIWWRVYRLEEYPPGLGYIIVGNRELPKLRLVWEGEEALDAAHALELATAPAVPAEKRKH